MPAADVAEVGGAVQRIASGRYGPVDGEARSTKGGSRQRRLDAAQPLAHPSHGLRDDEVVLCGEVPDQVVESTDARCDDVSGRVAATGEGPDGPGTGFSVAQLANEVHEGADPGKCAWPPPAAALFMDDGLIVEEDTATAFFADLQRPRAHAFLRRSRTPCRPQRFRLTPASGRVTARTRLAARKRAPGF